MSDFYLSFFDLSSKLFHLALEGFDLGNAAYHGLGLLKTIRVSLQLGFLGAEVGLGLNHLGVEIDLLGLERFGFVV